jgi:two-component system sensor histidine kinase KdpD
MPTSNAPGSRPPQALAGRGRAAGGRAVDVWTTSTSNTLESLVDVVWKITGARQRETVPDGALSRADEIELIDITPAELRERMAEGKVYLARRRKVAAERFFKTENLDGAARTGPAPRGPDRWTTS